MDRDHHLGSHATQIQDVGVGFTGYLTSGPLDVAGLAGHGACGARGLQVPLYEHTGNNWLRFYCPRVRRSHALPLATRRVLVLSKVLRRLVKFGPVDEWLGTILAWGVLIGGGLVLWGILLRGIFPVLDILSPLGPHAIAAAASAAIALMLERWRPFFLISALGAILVTPSVISIMALKDRNHHRQPWHDTAAGSARDEVPQLRVLSINTWHSNHDLAGLARYVLSADADVVVLSEFGPNKIPLLEGLKRAYPHQASCAAIKACSQVLLSRIPFVRSGTLLPTLKSPPIVWAEFHIGTVDVAKLTVMGTHVYRPSRRPDWHLAQLAGLAALVRKTEGSVVVAGDFNMTRMSQSFDDFTYASGLAAPSRLLASWPAWPVPLPQFQLDYAFVSNDIEILDQRLGHMIGSDHLPLWTAVSLPQRATVMASAHAGVESRNPAGGGKDAKDQVALTVSHGGSGGIVPAPARVQPRPQT